MRAARNQQSSLQRRLSFFIGYREARSWSSLYPCGQLAFYFYLNMVRYTLRASLFIQLYIGGRLLAGYIIVSLFISQSAISLLQIFIQLRHYFTFTRYKEESDKALKSRKAFYKEIELAFYRPYITIILLRQIIIVRILERIVRSGFQRPAWTPLALVLQIIALGRGQQPAYIRLYPLKIVQLKLVLAPLALLVLDLSVNTVKS